MANAQLRLRKLIITPRGESPILLVEVDIDYPDGTKTHAQFPGSTVATLATHLTAIQAEHPELCGVQGTVKDRLDWSGVVEPGKVNRN